MTKADKIRESIRKTKEKRLLQRPYTIELKIDYSKLNGEQKTKLKMYFVEAKWLYNYILSQEDPFKVDYKIKEVQVKNKDEIFETRRLKYLPAKLRQDIHFGLRQNIKNLSKAKKKGKRVGRLKFLSQISSINLTQYLATHKIVNNKIRLLGIKKYLSVFGLSQIKNTYEIANAKLIQKSSGYYIHLTCYEYVKPNMLLNNKEDIGLDFGIKNNITTSNGEVFNVSIGETEHLKRLQRKFSHQIKGSNNRYKTRIRTQKEYEKINNKKHDVANKIVYYILMKYNKVYMQDELLHNWHTGLFGKQIQHSVLGLIKSKLKQSKSVTVLPSHYPTTKLCYNCGKLNKITLADRTYKCTCGLSEDRDLKAAKTILHYGRSSNSYIPTERRDFKPVEKQTSISINSKFVETSYISEKLEAVERR